ncbi:MAG: hypothetical protein ACPGNP_11000 [Acidimicrobiales bacterium]
MTGTYFIDDLSVAQRTAATEWATALAEGRWAETTGVLRRRDAFTGVVAYCCLGAACDLFNPELWDLRDGHGHAPVDRYPTKEEGSPVRFVQADLPYNVRDHYGLRSIDGMPNDSAMLALVSLNDNGFGHPFIGRLLLAELGGSTTEMLRDMIAARQAEIR